MARVLGWVTHQPRTGLKRRQRTSPETVRRPWKATTPGMRYDEQQKLARYKVLAIWVPFDVAPEVAQKLTNHFCSNGESGGITRFLPEASIHSTLMPTTRPLSTLQEENYTINSIPASDFLQSTQFNVRKAFEKIGETGLSIYKIISQCPRPDGREGRLFLQSLPRQ